MKNIYAIPIIICLLLVVLTGFDQVKKSDFYYAYSEKISLGQVENKLAVTYDVNKRLGQEQLRSSLNFEKGSILWKNDKTCVIATDSRELSTMKGRLMEDRDIKVVNPVYAIDSGLEMIPTDEFLVKFKEEVSKKEIAALNEKFGVEVVKTTRIYQLLKVPKGTDVLEVANAYQETGLTEFSYPNFISDIEKHQQLPNDEYFPNQFSLHNTAQVFTDGHSGTTNADIDAPEAWEITQGANDVIIAVLDEGVTPNHPDLPNARQVRLNGSNFANGNQNDPSPTNDNNHGNGCAGIIGATINNNLGIAGIAPNCRIMPIRIFNTDGSGLAPNVLADAITFAADNGADIISNSWGYPSTNPNLHPVIRNAIIDATTIGRNNLGCVVVFSASNSANHVNNQDGDIRFPSNVNVAGVLTVGASDRFDRQANYSPRSNSGSSNNQRIDIVAPSHRTYSNQVSTETFGAWTIDIPGNPGYNPVNQMDGAPCPQSVRSCPIMERTIYLLRGVLVVHRSHVLKLLV